MLGTVTWRYKDIPILTLEDLAKMIVTDKYNLYGFIYRLKLLKENGDILYYIGKKNFYSIRTMLSKKDKIPRKGHIRFIKKRKDRRCKGKVEYEIYKLESNWLKYEGSYKSEEKYKLISKDIIDIAYSKIYLTYLEAYYLFKEKAIEDPKYINKCILGTFYRDKIQKDEDEFADEDVEEEENGS